MERIVENYFINNSLSGKELHDDLKNKVVTINTQSKAYMDRYIKPYIENNLIYTSYKNLTQLKILYGYINIKLTEFGIEYMENIGSMDDL